MTKVEWFKTGVGVVLTVGVGVIVGNAIKCVTPGPMGILKKVCVGIGSFVLGSMITDAVMEYADDKIDQGIEIIKEVVNETKREVKTAEV